MGDPRGRVGKVAEFQRSWSFDYLTAVNIVGSCPALATCETSQVLSVRWFYPGDSFFTQPTDCIVSIWVK